MCLSLADWICFLYLELFLPNINWFGLVLFEFSSFMCSYLSNPVLFCDLKKSCIVSIFCFHLFLYVCTVEFLWSHTTESMCVGYMSAQDSKAKVSAIILPQHANYVHSVSTKCVDTTFFHSVYQWLYLDKSSVFQPILSQGNCLYIPPNKNVSYAGQFWS